MRPAPGLIRTLAAFDVVPDAPGDRSQTAGERRFGRHAARTLRSVQ